METMYTPGENLREVVRALGTDNNAEGIMLLTTPQTPVINEILSELPVPVFGGKFPAVIADGEKREQGSVVAKLETEPALTVVPNLSEQPSDVITSLTSETAPGSGTAFVFADAYATGIDRFIRKLFRTCGTDYNYVGGGAGTLDGQQPSIYTEDGLVQDAAVVASLDNSSTIGVQHGWKKLAGPFQVTDADGSTVNSLEHRPAFRVYQEAIDNNGNHNLTRGEFFDTAKEYPFGISRIDGEAIVRDPFTVDTDGAITCFGNVPEGEFIHILTGDTDSLVAAASEAHDEAVSDGSGNTLFFDCISRVLYLEDEFYQEIEAVNPEIGALTIGEIANDGCGHLDYYNKTAVVLSLVHS